MMRRKKKRTQKKFFRFIFSLFLILFIGLFYLSRLLNQDKKLAYLPIPRINQVFLPNPLELPNILTNILGAQTIDPGEVVKYINIEREKVGVLPLRISPILVQGATLRADVILKYQNFSHQDPYENIELGTILPRLNYHFVYASENIGMGGISAEDFVKGFMNSKNHKENLLDPKFTNTGVAIVTGPYKQYYVNIAVQLFAIPGGKDEYLGYSKEDKEKYKTRLYTLNFKLNPIVWTLSKLMDNQQFNDNEYRKYSKQRELLANVYSPMKQGKPLTNLEVAMIQEYNHSLN